MSNQWFNDSVEDDQLFCPKCGGDDIHFDPAIHYGAQRSEITCVCDKCSKRFTPPYGWWQRMYGTDTKHYSDEELQALKEWLEDGKGE